MRRWRQWRGTGSTVRPGERVIDATEQRGVDPPDAWERRLDRRLLPSLQSEGMRGHPYRPVTLRDVPPAAIADLGHVIGDPVAERVFVLPSSRRTVDRIGNAWVTTPTRVIGVGRGAVALWVEDGRRPGIRARIPFEEVLAVLDLNILLFGRLEIVGDRDAFVVRYNAVNRPDLRDMLLPLRRSFRVAAGVTPTTSLGPGDLPLKWLNVVRSSDVQPLEGEDLALVAGGLGDPKARTHSGVGALTPRELVLATDPTPGTKEAEYGVDVVAVPRARLLALEGSGNLLEVRIAGATPTVLWLTVDAELAGEVRSIYGPALNGTG